MSALRISAMIHDGLLGGLPLVNVDRALAEADAALEAGAGELAVRINDEDASESRFVELCRRIKTGKATSTAALDVVLACDDPVSSVRMLLAADVRPDRITIMPETLDLFVRNAMRHTKRPLQTILDTGSLCRDEGLLLRFEIFHSGGAWFVDHLREAGLVDAPDCVLPFGLPGTCWSPVTAQTLRFRRSLVPPTTRIAVYCAAHDTVDAQLAAGFYAIAAGDGHDIRVGLDAWSISPDGNRFSSVAEQVALVGELIDMTGQPRDSSAARSP